MTLSIQDTGHNYIVLDDGLYRASFRHKSDAEAWVASKSDCGPLPEPVKHRCRERATGMVCQFCVYTGQSNVGTGCVHVHGMGNYAVQSFLSQFDILPECE